MTAICVDWNGLSRARNRRPHQSDDGLLQRNRCPGRDQMPDDARQYASERRAPLAVSCAICHHEATLNVEAWSDDVPVPTFGPRMVCTRCGIIGADARPNWKEQVTRPSLTGRNGRDERKKRPHE